MQDFLPFIVIGLATGAVYGLAGVGLVLAYKTSGIFNLAYGAIAALTVFVFYWLHDEHGWPWGLAAAVCVLVIGPAEGLLMELLGRALERVGATLKVVATVGLLLIVLGVGELWYGNNEVNFPPFLPTSTVPILGVNVGWDQITVTIISLIATAVLYWFFRSVRMGYAMRGVVDNPDLLSMTGENPIRVRRWAWIISMTFCSMAGLLLAPGSQPERRHHLDPRRLRLRGGGDRRLLEPAAHVPRRAARRHRRVPDHQVLRLHHLAERSAAGDPLHRPLPGPVRHAQGEAGRAPRRDDAAGQEVLVRAVAGPGHHVRRSGWSSCA